MNDLIDKILYRFYCLEIALRDKGVNCFVKDEIAETSDNIIKDIEDYDRQNTEKTGTASKKTS